MSDSPTASIELLSTKALSLCVAGKLLMNDLNLCVPQGASLGVLGPNGTGKTSLLHALANLQGSSSGQIQLLGKDLLAYSRKELSLLVGILMQSADDEMPASTLEFAMSGRHPHLPAWRWEGKDDLARVSEALRLLGIDSVRDQDIRTLSGGERQRLAIATLLTQDPRLYLLDEPSNHLDIALQIKSLEILHTKVKNESGALIMATHDINLASRFCDQILLLIGDGQFIYGDRADVLTTENLSTAFDCEIQQFTKGPSQFFFPAT
ncbi:MAG: ABC transporter ATP-binding protein [Pseudohongiellaceae bacterium]|nr:ABC transporter ATP-binding protein [Pseudohongiellaceae bacterium]